MKTKLTHDREPRREGTPGLRFLASGMYAFFSRTPSREYAIDRCTEFCALSVVMHAVLIFITVEYFKHGGRVFSRAFKQNPSLKLEAIGASVALYLVLTFLFKRLVPKEVIRERAEASPRLSLAVGLVFFFWTLASPVMFILFWRGTFAPVLHLLGIG